MNGVYMKTYTGKKQIFNMLLAISKTLQVAFKFRVYSCFIL